jgi:hypothetical protein
MPWREHSTTRRVLHGERVMADAALVRNCGATHRGSSGVRVCVHMCVCTQVSVACVCACHVCTCEAYVQIYLCIPSAPLFAPIRSHSFRTLMCLCDVLGYARHMSTGASSGRSNRRSSRRRRRRRSPSAPGCRCSKCCRHYAEYPDYLSALPRARTRAAAT